MTNTARKHPESQLTAAPAERWYQETLSAIGDAVLSIDPDGRVIYLNAAAERVTGWSAQDAYGLAVEDVYRVIDEESRQPIRVPRQGDALNGFVAGAENRRLLLTKEGSEVAITESFSPVRSPDGELSAVVLVFRDSSEQREKEQLFQHSLDYLSGIVDTVRDPLVVLDANLRVCSASSAFYETFQVKREETEQHLIYELGNGQWDIPRLRTLLEEILPRSNSFRDFEVSHKFEGIGERRMLLNSRKIHGVGSHEDAILLSIEDVTPSWRSGVDFADNRERYRVIVEGAIGFAIFTFDTEGVITSWNVGAEEVLGYSEAEILGRNFSIIFRPEDIEKEHPDEEMRIAALEGRALDERWHLRKSGEPFYGQGLVMPLKDENDQLRGFLKILRDKTDERRLQEALQRRTDELEQADLQKNAFLAMLAHELRNPLAAISSGVSLAKRSSSEETVAYAHKVIEQQIENLARLIDDLLDVSRISRGTVDLKREIVDIAEVLRRALDVVGPLAEKKRHHVQVKLPEEALEVDVDPTRMEQVIVNLLNNACKYTQQEGTIHVSVERRGEQVAVVVSDTGVGISPEMLPRVFDLFTQVEGSLDRCEGGLGIGLTVVKQLVEMHGGTVHAASTPGEGSEFTVRLPLARRADAGGGLEESEKNARETKKLLIVDDNVDTAELTGMLLQSIGFVVRVAHDGPSALEAASEFRPDVMLLDIGLPGMDGFELARRLRQEDYGREAIIVGLSGYSDAAALKKGREAGFDHHLVKPLVPDRLVSLIQEREHVDRLPDEGLGHENC